MKILLAVDDSPFSQQALQHLIEEFRPRSMEVQVVHAVEPISTYFSAEYFPHFVPYVENVEQDRLKQARALVEKVCTKLRKAGFRNRNTIVHGDARTAILELARQWKPDLIVLGSHGLKGLNRLLMGSVSEAVMRHAPCSVQVVRVQHAVQPVKPRPRARARRAPSLRHR